MGGVRRGWMLARTAALAEACRYPRLAQRRVGALAVCVLIGCVVWAAGIGVSGLMGALPASSLPAWLATPWVQLACLPVAVLVLVAFQVRDAALYVNLTEGVPPVPGLGDGWWRSDA